MSAGTFNNSGTLRHIFSLRQRIAKKTAGAHLPLVGKRAPAHAFAYIMVRVIAVWSPALSGRYNCSLRVPLPSVTPPLTGWPRSPFPALAVISVPKEKRPLFQICHCIDRLFQQFLQLAQFYIKNTNRIRQQLVISVMTQRKEIDKLCPIRKYRVGAKGHLICPG